jgi:cytokinin riboside 5'-monophosphate phosphoribohydrolase
MEKKTITPADLTSRPPLSIQPGGNVGLMGAVAEAAAAGGAPVTGVIPAALQPREISGATVGERVVVPDMHTRKRTMFEAADAFIALPGGFGTLEEVIEMVTWHQLGYHSKPVAFLNTAGFYDPLLSFFDHACEAGFIAPGVREIAMAAETPGAALDALASYERVAPPVFQAPEAALTTDELA